MYQPFEDIRDRFSIYAYYQHFFHEYKLSRWNQRKRNFNNIGWNFTLPVFLDGRANNLHCHRAKCRELRCKCFRCSGLYKNIYRSNNSAGRMDLFYNLHQPRLRTGRRNRIGHNNRR